MNDENKASELVATATVAALDLTATAAAAAKDVVAVAAEAAHSVRIEEKKDEDWATRVVVNALHRVLGEKDTEQQRFINVSRIPLICQNIDSIHTSIKKIEDKLDTQFVTVESFSPYRRALNTVAGLILVAVVGGILSLIFIK